MDIRKLQRAIVDGLDDVKAQNTVVFDTEALSPLFERVIIASGTSNRQTRALAASVRDAVKALGEPPPRTEGEDNGEWIIVDCGAAVVHVMQPAIRDYYRLEEIWGGKPVLLKSRARVRSGLPKAAEPQQPDEPASTPTGPGKAAARGKATASAKSARAAKPAPGTASAAGKGSSRTSGSATTGTRKATTKATPKAGTGAATKSVTKAGSKAGSEAVTKAGTKAGATAARRAAAAPAAPRQAATAAQAGAAGKVARRAATGTSARRAPASTSSSAPSGRTVVAKTGTARKTAAAPRRSRGSTGGA
jgi:ribosome-associated protein